LKITSQLGHIFAPVKGKLGRKPSIVEFHRKAVVYRALHKGMSAKQATMLVNKIRREQLATLPVARAKLNELNFA
jgi:hypothetical protein